MDSVPDVDLNPVYPIDLSIFKEHIKSSFLGIIDDLPIGQKAMVIERSLTKVIDFFLELQLLKERDIGRIVTLSRNPLAEENHQIVYVVSPKVELLEDIFFHIQDHSNNKIQKEYTVIFIPQMTYDVQMFIDNNIYKSDLKIKNLPIDVYPLERDLISLEENNAMNEIFIQDNNRILATMTKAIVKFETIFGKIKYKYTKGEKSKLLKTLLEIEEQASPYDAEDEILGAIILDRSVDFVTPLCSSYTYEALLDEHIGITYNVARVNPSILEKKTDSKDIKIELSNSKDSIFAQIRNMCFNSIGNFFPEYQRMTNELKEKMKSDDLSVVHENMPHLQRILKEDELIYNHLNIADYLNKITKKPLNEEYTKFEQSMLAGVVPEKIMDFYNNEFAKQTNICKVMRLICLNSLIGNGLPLKLYDGLKMEFLRAYGYQELFLLKNLEKLRILRKNTEKSQYDKLIESLRLINERVNLIEPDDASYVFGGYCPITVRLIESVLLGGWNSVKETLKKVPGEMEFPEPREESALLMKRSNPNIILLVFLGGITYSEVAAIRYLNRRNRDYKFVILTTNLINGNKFIDGLRVTFEQNLSNKDFFTQLKQGLSD